MEDSETVRTLFVTVVAEVISFGVLIPLAPLFFTEPSSSLFLLPEGMTVQQGYILLGLLIGLYPLGQFLSNPILGELSDIYGRKRVIQLSIIGTVLTSLIFAVGIAVGSLVMLFVSRLFNGLTGGLISVAQASIADVTEDSERSRNFGIIGAAFGIGFLIGPFLGGFLSSGLLTWFNPVTPFIFASLVSLSSLVMVTVKLRETGPGTDKNVNWMKPFTQLRKGLRLQGLKRLYGANFFYFSGFAFYTTFIPVYLVQSFGFSQFDVGNFFLYIGVLVIFAQGVLVPYVFSRFDEGRVMPWTLLATGISIFLLPVPDRLLIFLLIVPLVSVNHGLTQVSLNTLISVKASKTDQGLALGTNQSLRALGNAGPSMLSGVAAAAFAASMPIHIAGAIMVVTAVGYIISRRKG